MVTADGISANIRNGIVTLEGRLLSYASRESVEQTIAGGWYIMVGLWIAGFGGGRLFHPSRKEIPGEYHEPGDERPGEKLHRVRAVLGDGVALAVVNAP